MVNLVEVRVVSAGRLPCRPSLVSTNSARLLAVHIGLSTASNYMLASFSVLAAKVLVFGAVTLVVAEFVTFAGFFSARRFSPHQLRMPRLSMAPCEPPLASAFSCASSDSWPSASSHDPAHRAISAYVGVILALPIIVPAILRSLQYQIERLLPLEIGLATISNPAPHAIGPWTGFLIFFGYTARVLGLGTVLLVRRDARNTSDVCATRSPRSPRP
jgi:hypothetical protein